MTSRLPSILPLGVLSTTLLFTLLFMTVDCARSSTDAVSVSPGSAQEESTIIGLRVR